MSDFDPEAIKRMTDRVGIFPGAIDSSTRAAIATCQAAVIVGEGASALISTTTPGLALLVLEETLRDLKGRTEITPADVQAFDQALARSRDTFPETWGDRR